jgi:hypothetical protein
MPEASRVIALVEDDRHKGFVWRFLKRLGYSTHAVTFEPLPAGRGCGEQWVRVNYCRVVAAYRERAAKAQTRLIVAIDADTGTVHNRANQLAEALRLSGLQARALHEHIAHLIPKRHIETWVLYLNDQPADEATDYRHAKEIDSEIPSAALKFFDWTRPNATVPETCLPSIQVAVPEIRRIE